jgi:hypothetical protein
MMEKRPQTRRLADRDRRVLIECLRKLKRPVPEHVMELETLSQVCNGCPYRMSFGFGEYCIRPDVCPHQLLSGRDGSTG